MQTWNDERSGVNLDAASARLTAGAILWVLILGFVVVSLQAWRLSHPKEECDRLCWENEIHASGRVR